MKDWLYLVLITFVPGIELRGSIPIGILNFKFNPITVFFVLSFVNLLIIPVVFVFWDYILLFAEKIKFIDVYLKRLRVRSKNVIDKFGFVGLTLFVAIPLPGTGAYTGAFVAEIFDMNKKIAFFAIAGGVLIAGILVTLATIGVFSFVKI